MRLKTLRLRLALRKLERSVKAKEELAEGLHLIDFEQLRIENQSLTEKIEERNEELLKLKKKTTTTLQVGGCCSWQLGTELGDPFRMCSNLTTVTDTVVTEYDTRGAQWLPRLFREIQAKWLPIVVEHYN